MKPYIPPQIPRLVLAFAIFISLFLGVRKLLVPDTFGQYGYYRGASLTENAQQEIHYSGQQSCIECHQDIEDLKIAGLHSGIRCEACHGPGQKHFISGDVSDIFKPTGREACGKCHGIIPGRPKDAVIQVDLEKHNVGKNCTECHNAHEPWTMKE